MGDIINLAYYRQLKADVIVRANDNMPSNCGARYWTDDHHEISFETYEGHVIAKEHPNPQQR